VIGCFDERVFCSPGLIYMISCKCGSCCILRNSNALVLGVCSWQKMTSVWFYKKTAVFGSVSVLQS